MTNILVKGKSVLNEVFFNSLSQACLYMNIPSNVILMYHGVDLIGNTKFNMRHTSVKCLESHIRFLKKYCNVITLADFFAKKFKPGKFNVTITFDDGYANNFKYALPVFEKYKVPASFFITGLNLSEYPVIWADFLNVVETLTSRKIEIDGESFEKKHGIYCSSETGTSLYEVVKKQKSSWDYKVKLMKELSEEYSEVLKSIEFSDYWKLMTDKEIRESAKSKFIEIGSHGFFHNNLGNIPLQNAREELILSKKYLENLIQKEVVSLGYPDGSYSMEVKSAAESIGFTYQLAADGLICADDKQDLRIRDRAGVYTCGRCGTQLFDALKRYN